MIFVNFKTFGQTAGENVSGLVNIIEEVSSSTGVKIISTVQLIDAVKNVWVQHLEEDPEKLVGVGVAGLFLNHSDHKYSDWGKLLEDAKRCREVGLKTQVFADNLDELKKVLELKPNFIAYEPPELIGSEETSVAASKPEVIGEAVKLAKAVSIPLVVGAGIKSKEDVKKSLELGAVGIAVSSAVVKSLDPKKVLLELTEGFTA